MEKTILTFFSLLAAALPFTGAGGRLNKNAIITVSGAALHPDLFIRDY